MPSSGAIPSSSNLAGELPGGRRAGGALVALILAASAIGFAIHLHGGEYSPLAISLITVAIFGATAGVVFSRWESTRATPWRWIDLAFAVALAAQFFALHILWPVGVDQRPP